MSGTHGWISGSYDRHAMSAICRIKLFHKSIFRVNTTSFKESPNTPWDSKLGLVKVLLRFVSAVQVEAMTWYKLNKRRNVDVWKLTIDT